MKSGNTEIDVVEMNFRLNQVAQQTTRALEAV